MKPSRYQYRVPPGTIFLNAFRKLFILFGIDRIIGTLSRTFRAGVIYKFVPAHYLYSPNTIRECLVNGIKFKLDIGETNGHSCYFNLPEKGHDALLAHLKEGMTVIDVGANIGVVTLKMAQKIKQEGKVYSFEPSVINAYFAKENFLANEFKNIQLIHKGIGDQKSSAFLCNVNPINRGMARVINSNDINCEKELIEIDTLDNCIEDFRITRPDLIKIDVEGFEFKVLKGAHHTLTQYKPLLFIEIDNNNLRDQNSSAKEVIQFLKQLKYNISNATTNEEIDQNSDFENCHFDALCESV